MEGDGTLFLAVAFSEDLQLTHRLHVIDCRLRTGQGISRNTFHVDSQRLHDEEKMRFVGEKRVVLNYKCGIVHLLPPGGVAVQG